MDVEEMVRQMELEEARIDQQTIFVKNMLRHTDCTDEKIAELVGVPLSFVGKVRKSWVFKL